MVTHWGYCRPIGEKVEFNVERIVKLDTKKGIKWQVKGQYGTHNISVFTSEETATKLNSQLDVEEPTVFNAEIAWQCEEVMPYFNAEEVVEEVEIEEIVEDSAPQVDTKLVTIHDDEGGSDKEGKRLDLHTTLPEKYLKIDGSPDMRYNICKAWVAKHGTQVLETETVSEQPQPTIAVIKDAEDVDTYQSIYRAEPSDICFTDHIPPETWNMMGPDAQGTYLTTRDESMIVCHRCGTSKADLRADEDANSECNNCVFEKDFAPMHWVDELAPTNKRTFSAESSLTEEGTLMPDFSELTIPKTVYYEIIDMLPDTVISKESIDGFSMTLTYLPQDAKLMEGISDMDTPNSPEQDTHIVLSAEEQETFMADSWRTSADGEVMTESEFFKNIFNIPEDADIRSLPTGEVVVSDAESFDAEFYEKMYPFVNPDYPGTPTIVVEDDDEITVQAHLGGDKKGSAVITPEDDGKIRVRVSSDKDGGKSMNMPSTIWKEGDGDFVLGAEEGSKVNVIDDSTVEVDIPESGPITEQIELDRDGEKRGQLSFYNIGGSNNPKLQVDLYGDEESPSMARGHHKFGADSFYQPVEVKNAEDQGIIDEYVKCVYPKNKIEQKKLMSDIIAGNTNITIEHMELVISKTAPADIKWPEWVDDEGPEEEEIYEDVEWEAEHEAPKPTTIAALLAVGGLVAYFAPEQVRNFFKAFK